jgi:hypothetical protein
VTLTDTVRVNAVGFAPRRIGLAGLPAWLSVSPTVASTPASFEFTFHGASAPRDTNALVTVRDLDDSLGREDLYVTVRTVRPELLALPASVNFDLSSRTADSAAVVISNRKPGPLDWTSSNPTLPWTARRAGLDTVWVAFSQGQLASSVWTDTLWITDTLAVNSPLAVPLSADNGVIPPAPPYLVVTPPYVAWRSRSGQATRDSATVVIKASYDTAMAFRISNYPSWLYVSDTAGFVPRSLTLRAGYDTIPFGVYEDTVWIEAPAASNSPYALPIIFTADVVSATPGETPSPAAPEHLGVRPNPFNSNVLIEWSGGTGVTARLEIFDLLGRRVLTKDVTGGRFNWVPERGAASGVYLMKLTQGNQVRTRQLLFLK